MELSLGLVSEKKEEVIKKKTTAEFTSANQIRPLLNQEKYQDSKNQNEPKSGFDTFKNLVPV